MKWLTHDRRVEVPIVPIGMLGRNLKVKWGIEEAFVPLKISAHRARQPCTANNVELSKFYRELPFQARALTFISGTQVLIEHDIGLERLGEMEWVMVPWVQADRWVEFGNNVEKLVAHP